MQTEKVRICANTKRPCTHVEPCKNAPPGLVTLSSNWEPAPPMAKDENAHSSR